MMRTIMTLNATCGCGKSTLASYYANRDKAVTLVDLSLTVNQQRWFRFILPTDY